MRGSRGHRHPSQNAQDIVEAKWLLQYSALDFSRRNSYPPFDRIGSKMWYKAQGLAVYAGGGSVGITVSTRSRFDSA